MIPVLPVPVLAAPGPVTSVQYLPDCRSEHGCYSLVCREAPRCHQASEGGKVRRADIDSRTGGNRLHTSLVLFNTFLYLKFAAHFYRGKVKQT